MKKFDFTRAITHSGVFHADEVFATAIMQKLNPFIEIKRVTKVPDDISAFQYTIVYDIGGGEYDHHQKGGNGCHEDGIPFSSAGLIWRDFGELLVSSKEVADNVEKMLIEAIDASDNGINLKGSDVSFSISTVSSIISSFNPSWDSDEYQNDAFTKAVDFASTILENTINCAESQHRAKDLVKFAVSTAQGHVMILDKYMPWQEFLLSDDEGDDILFVVFPSNRGGYNVQSVPVELGSFETRKLLPAPWRGLNQEELRHVTGILSITFIHNAGFIGGCETFKDAMLLAQSAVAWMD